MKYDISLVLRAQAGDRETLDQLAVTRLAEIRKRVHALANNRSDRDELTQAGLIGFCEAVRYFDPNRAARDDGDDTVAFLRFATRYENWRIWEARARLLGYTDTQRHLHRTVMAAYDRLAQDFSRTPTVVEVAAATGQSLRDVQVILEGGRALHVVEAPGVPGAMEIFDFWSSFSTDVVCTLGATLGRKWLVLCLLVKDFGGFHWGEIVESLKDPDGSMNRVWPEILRARVAPDELPVNWRDVCALFRSPPPPLQQDPLQNWYRYRMLQVATCIGHPGDR